MHKSIPVHIWFEYVGLNEQLETKVFVFSTFSQNDKCVGVGFSCIWKRDDTYDIVDKHFDVLAWHKVAAEIAADHHNPLEKHLVAKQQTELNFSKSNNQN